VKRDAACDIVRGERQYGFFYAHSFLLKGRKKIKGRNDSDL
jgi:hypothetical protein